MESSPQSAPKKLDLSLMLYKKWGGVTNSLKQGIIDSLLEDLDATSQRPDTWDLAERIETLITKSKLL